MPDFNPDEYLKTQTKSSDFNPDSYLSKNGVQKKNGFQESKPTVPSLKAGGIAGQGFQTSTNQPIVPTILTPEKQREYIKNLKTYTKPKAKPKTLREAVDDDDSYLGALWSNVAPHWNTVVGSISDAVGGAANLLAKAEHNNVGMALDIGAKAQDLMTIGYSKALGVEPEMPVHTLRDNIKDNTYKSGDKLGKYASETIELARSSASTKENEEKIQSGFDISDGFNSKDLKALPIMLTRLAADIGLSIPTGGASFIAQGYKQGIDDYDESIGKSGVEPDDNTRELFGMGYSIVNGVADKVGANAILKNSPVKKSVQNAILRLGIKQLAKTEGKITSEVLEKTFTKVAQDTFSKIRTAGVKSLTAGATEGGTEAVQGGLSDALKIITNKVKGEDVFNQKEVLTDFWKNRLNDFAGGAVLGGFAGGATNGFRSSKSYVAERVAESTSPDQLQNLKDELAFEVEQGTLEEERAVELNTAIDKYSEIAQRIPTGAKDRVKAIQLIEERDSLKELKNTAQSQAENLDEALAPQIEGEVSVLQNKEDQLNDQIREKTTGDKYKYFKDPEKDKYYKQLGEGKPEDITQEYYELQKQDTQLPKLEEETKADEQIPETTDTTEQVLPEQELQGETQSIGQNDTVEPTEVIQENQTPLLDEQGQIEPEITPNPNSLDYSDIVAQPTNATKATIASQREEMGLPEIEVDGKRTDKQVSEDANELIKDESKTFKLVDDLINGRKKTIEDTEVSVLTKLLADRTAKRDRAKGNLMNAVRNEDQRSIDKFTAERELLTKEVSDIQTAIRFGGRGQGRGLRQLQIAKTEDNTLEGFIDRALRDNGGKVLSQEQIKQAETAYNEYEKLWTESQAKLAETETELEKLKSEYIALKFKKESDGTRRKNRSNLSKDEKVKEILAERKLILTELSQVARKSMANMGANRIPFEFVKPLSKLARNYIEEGVVELDALIGKIREDIIDYLPDATDKDIRDAISGYDRNMPVTRDGIEQQVQELKTQARLISAIEDAENKVAKSFGTKKKEASDLVKELRQTLKDLTGNEYGVAALKVRIKNQIDDLTRRLKEKDYVMPTKKVLDLDEEAKVLRDKALKVKREFQIASEKNKMALRTKNQKRVDDLNNVVGLVKAIKASWDLSAPFRQGIVASVSHPIIAGEAFWKMHKAAVSEKYFERWRNDLESHPLYDLMQDSGLSLTSSKTVNMLAKEEDFSSNLADRVPLVKASERAYSFYLNTLRANIFLDAVTQLEIDGITFESHPDEYKSLARVINNTTGRGGLGKLERHADLAGVFLWSPRLMASRINTFTSIFDPSYTPRARKRALKELYQFIGAVSAMMFMASANDDWEIEWNPLSSNFGKVKRGDVRHSVMGGVESYITFMARQLTWHTKTGKNIKSFSDPRYKGKNAWDFIGTFARGKVAPDLGTIVNLLAQEDVVGNKYGWWDVPDELLPLVIPETMEAYKAGGIAEVLKTIPFTTYGIGSSRYPDGKGKRKKEMGVWESLYNEITE